MVEAAHRSELDAPLLLRRELPRGPRSGQVREALERVPLRVHQDVVVTTQMLLEPGEEVVLLPPPPATSSAMAAPRPPPSVACRVRPPGGGAGGRGAPSGRSSSIWRDGWTRAPTSSSSPRARTSAPRFARIVPTYRGVETLSKLGDNLQWGGERLGEGGRFPTPDGKAHFAVVKPPPPPEPGRFRLSTRRGKQFNYDGVLRGATR